MKKLFLMLLLLLFSSALNAVYIYNDSSLPINLVDFSFISGIEIYMCPITLAPGEKYQHGDIASCDIYFSAHKIKYKLRDLKPDTMVTCEMLDGVFTVQVQKTDIIKPVFEPLFEMSSNTILKSEK